MFCDLGSAGSGPDPRRPSCSGSETDRPHSNQLPTKHKHPHALPNSSLSELTIPEPPTMVRLRPSPQFYRTRAFVAFVVVALVSRVILSPASLYTPSKSAIYSPFAQLTPPIQNSIVIPAFHEQPNLRPLVIKVFAALRERGTTEIIVVDDNSQDGTVEEVERLKREGYRVELVVRTTKGERGLSSAVLRGFERARGRKWLVMDADLQVKQLATLRSCA